MRNYRAKIKCQKVSETDRKLKLDAQKKYMKEYRKKKSTNTNDLDKLKNRAKQNEYMKQYKNKIKLTTNETDKLKEKSKKKEYMKEYRKKRKIKKMTPCVKCKLLTIIPHVQQEQSWVTKGQNIVLY